MLNYLLRKNSILTTKKRNCMGSERKINREKTARIIERFHYLFPKELEFEQETLILNEAGSFDYLIIIPKKLTPEKLMFELESVIEVTSFVEADEFYETFDLIRRQEGTYALFLDDCEGDVEKENSITLFEGLFAFLLGSLKENYCTGSSIKDEPGYYPYFIHNDRDGGLLVISKSLNNKFLEAKKIKKMISLQ